MCRKPEKIAMCVRFECWIPYSIPMPNLSCTYMCSFFGPLTDFQSIYISVSRAIACAARDPKLSPSWVDFGLPTVAWRYLKLNFLCQSCHLTWGYWYWAFLPAPKGMFFSQWKTSVSACLSPLLSFSSHPNLEKNTAKNMRSVPRSFCELHLCFHLCFRGLLRMIIMSSKKLG